MGTRINVKNPETVRLAHELASRTGQSLTATIRGALERDLLARGRDPGRSPEKK